MDVKVIDRLSTVASGVDHGAKSRLRESDLIGDLWGKAEEVAKQWLVNLRNIVERIDVLFGNDQYVVWGLRIDVVEGISQSVLIDLGGWDFARQNPTKKAGTFRH